MQPFRISGNIDALASVQILDASGKKVNQGSRWSDSGATRKITYDLSKPLSDDMTLQIEIWPGQKTLTVPIELKNVTLPRRRFAWNFLVVLLAPC